MPLKTSLGSAWLTDGTTNATTGNTGLATLTGSPKFGTTADLPDGTLASPYIVWAENTAGTFKIDAAYTSELSAGPTTQEVTIFAWLALEQLNTASSWPADGTAVSGSNMFRWASAGTKFRWYPSNSRGTGGTFPAIMDGLSFILSATQTGGTTTTEQNVNASGDAPVWPVAPVGSTAWVRVGIRLYKNSAGKFTIYFNNQILGEITGLDFMSNTDTGSTILDSDIQGDWTVSLPAIPGARWKLGPVESWYDTASGVPDWTYRPIWGGNTSADTLRRWISPTWINRPDGGGFSGTVDSGSPTTAAATAGNRRNLRQIVNAAGAASYTMASYDKLGSFTYGDAGWAHVVFPMVYFPANSTGQLDIRNDGDAASFATVTLDGTNIKCNGVQVRAHDPTHRYRIVCSFSSAGELNCWAHDETESGATTLRDSTISVTGGWTPAAVGVVKINATFTGAATAETEGVGVCSQLILAGVDSYSHGLTSLSPAYGSTNHVAQVISYGAQAQMMPGSSYPHYEYSFGRHLMLPVGYTGHTLSAFVNSECLPGLDYLRGANFYLCGSLTNDINLGGTTASQMATVVSTGQTDLRTLVRYLTARGNTVTLCDSYVWNYLQNIDGATCTIARSGTTVTITYTGGTFNGASNYSVGQKISVFATDKTASGQSVTLTGVAATTITYTTSASGALAANTGSMRYFNDAQIAAFTKWQFLLPQVASEMQTATPRINFWSVGGGKNDNQQAFSAGPAGWFTNEVHPSDAALVSGVRQAIQHATSSAYPYGWKRRRRREFMQF